jgi:hypothetical protein
MATANTSRIILPIGVWSGRQFAVVLLWALGGFVLVGTIMSFGSSCFLLDWRGGATAFAGG